MEKNPLPSKHTVWQDYCSYLNATYKLVELREIARNANICYYYRMNKKELCQALTESYEEYVRFYEDESKKNDISCKSGTLDLRSAIIPRNFETYPPAYFIRDSDGYCFSLFEIQEALDKGDPTVMNRLKSMKTDDGQNFLDVFYSRGDYLSTFNPKLSKIHKLQSF